MGQVHSGQRPEVGVISWGHGPRSAIGASVPARKIMLYSHDTYGLGHLRRNLRIAGHLLHSVPGLQVVLVSGSPVAERFPTPPGLTVVKLPSVRKVGAEQYRPVSPGLDLSLVRRTRSAIMADVVRRWRPDVLLVDHSPAGMNGELLEVFSTLERHSPATRVALGLRDILDDPATVVRTWTGQGIYPLLADVYDQIVVYGSRDLFDVGLHYRLPEPVAGRLFYTGYISPGADADTARGPGAKGSGAGGSAPYLLATAGGGGDGVTVLGAAMEAGAALGTTTKVVAGPLIDEAAFGSLSARAERTPGVELVKFHPQLQRAMADASAIITMGGYNSLCEALSVGVPTVVVPRSVPRLEQTIRAGLFAERGLVSVVAAGPDLGDRLARAVAATMSRPAAVRSIDLGGLERLAGVLLTGEAAAGVDGPGEDGTVERPGSDRLEERLPA